MSEEEKGPIVGFQLNLVGRLNPAKLRTAAQQNPESTTTEGKRRDQERARKLIDSYTDEMILGLVHDYRTCNDANMRFKIANLFLNRAHGTAKPISEEERKGADAHSILDVLAAMSGTQAALERGTPDTPALEHPTIDDDESAEAFFKELDRARKDDIVDGDIVSD